MQPLPIRIYEAFKIRGQCILDKSISWPTARWLIFAVLTKLYVIRIMYAEWAFALISYALGLYLLSLVVEWLRPLQSDEELSRRLPISNDEDYKPFIRKLSGFNLWLRSTKAMIAAHFAICCPYLDIPEFWPLLLAYWVLMCVLSLNERIDHMIKFRYYPWDSACWSKRKYRTSVVTKAQRKTKFPKVRKPIGALGRSVQQSMKHTLKAVIH